MTLDIQPKTSGDVITSADFNAIVSAVNANETAINDKVDKEQGKGLSTNDYTTEEKEKLAGVEVGAEVNVVASVAGKTGAVVLNKSDVGLGNVDNTSDINKPVSNPAMETLCPQTETTSLTITDAIPHNAIDYTIYGNTGGVGDLVVDGDSDYAEYGGKYRIPVSVRGKNLLDSSLLTDAENYTLDSWYSGSYKAIAIPIPNGTYVFSTKRLSGFSPTQDNTLSVTSYIDTNPRVPSGSIYESKNVYYDKKITLTVTEGYVYFSAFRRVDSELEEFYSNVQVILEKGSAGTDYEPYVAPQTVNIYLDDPIEEGQSISLADTNVPIPLISRDTNIIEFGTSVQPSSVKIKYYQNINKVIANLQALILNQVANLQALILSYHS